MPTNDDRSRVAQALREMETPTWPTLTEAVMGHVAAREKVVERLADLIEPPRQCPHYHSDRHYCSVHEEVRQIDRDALLALEDEMFEDATGLALISQLEKNEELQDLQSTMAKALMDYARRIREACGVEP